ncbi:MULTISPECIES: sensor histidine kinase [Thalassospira]|jgi:signal transduction histidine kinase|uniref:sensor histidine kinase n=1 Tax=Thalassospira TaxID=168934 RepID=UPI0008288580|nr:MULTISPECIES: HAMP domain-containing sensor histidine kinase [Thalassospira]OCK07472.1 integral membrane sensor signal transduction histidine kinase [Thalassospira sp. KO164]PXX33189.1 signal transduction histidine kinase [Thalassospira sp. 11-3]SEE10681.1 Signal transduction histidine kinase [Thalassospira permensis]|tara:strand:- start:3371 stop:4672 length:1302 start_codon:yes stop_codon:yes gene_type:complete
MHSCAPIQKTFSRFVRNYVLLALVITLVIYTGVVNFYMLYGKWMVASFQLQTIAEQYDEMRAKDPTTPLPNGFNIQTFTDYDALPKLLRDSYKPNDIDPGELYYLNTDKYAAQKDPDNPVFLVFPHILANGTQILLLQTYHAGDEDSVYFSRLHKLALLSIPFALGVVAIFAYVLWLIGKRMTQPSENLQSWAKTLSTENLDQPVPDFGFTELNDVAKELHQSLVRVDKFVTREREFLRQASHELRTPVTIVSGNVELLDKTPLNEIQVRLAARIKRANRNMQQLIETLLWLGREATPNGIREKIDYPAFVREAIVDLAYLTDGKNLTCEFSADDQSGEIIASPAALMIVVSNLIRNAFEHTPKGQVTVRLEANRLIVENNLMTCAGDYVRDQGEGIGLHLVRRICERCNWHCDTTFLAAGGMRAIFTVSNHT